MWLSIDICVGCGRGSAAYNQQSSSIPDHSNTAQLPTKCNDQTEKYSQKQYHSRYLLSSNLANPRERQEFAKYDQILEEETFNNHYLGTEPLIKHQIGPEILHE